MERRKAIYRDELLEEELYIPTSAEGGVWLDILLYDWIEGETLLECIKRAVSCGDRSALRRLSESFDTLSLNLLQEEWAHGDVTCENIIVDSAGSLHLIDLDNSFIPTLAGEISIELGTEAFQHPNRTIDHFDRNIDDYPLALISTALSLLTLDHTIYEDHAQCDGLLFDPAKILRGDCCLYKQCLAIFASRGEATAYRIATLLPSRLVDLPTLHHLLRHKLHGTLHGATPTTPVCRNGLWGYLDKDGREVIPPIFDTAREFRESLSVVKISSVWHYIDCRGHVAINGHGYQALKSIRNGVGRAKRDGEWVEILLE